MVEGVEERAEARQATRHITGIDRLALERYTSVRARGVLECCDVRKPIRQGRVDAHTRCGERVKHLRNGSASPGAQIEDMVTSGSCKSVGEQRHDCPMQVEASLDKMQVIGRVVADTSRKPGLIFELEQMAATHRPIRRARRARDRAFDRAAPRRRR